MQRHRPQPVAAHRATRARHAACATGPAVMRRVCAAIPIAALAFLAAWCEGAACASAPQLPPMRSLARAQAAQPVVLTAAARWLSTRVRQSADNRGAPFLVLDKRAARLWVFDRNGHLRSSTPVLLGLAVGDDSVPGIGLRQLADIQPFERTTPAGRFVIEPGHNLHGDRIFWIDYDAAVSMHRVRSAQPGEQRLQRLASATAADNRISFGCINVPVAFYNRVLNRYFADSGGIAYVLPEVRSMASVFAFIGDPAEPPITADADASVSMALKSNRPHPR
jgi:hypothetical protein